jgi:hypothetical protein
MPAGFWLRASAVVLLFMLLQLAYAPSLDHGPRQDQWPFLIDTMDTDGFLDNVAHCYSYNRTRVVGTGDYQLFRPLLFALLSAEKALFGNHFSWWQSVGISLHCLVVFLLLLVLLQVHRLLTVGDEQAERTKGWFSEERLLKWLAWALVLFFSLNVSIIEMVIWSHINGYLLFMVFALGSLLLSLRLLGHPEPFGRRRAALLVGAFLLVLLAAFTWEIGQFFAVVLGAVLALAANRNGRRIGALGVFALFASVFLMYQGINFLDRLAHPGEADVTLAQVAQEAAHCQTLEHARRYILYTAVQPFLPSRIWWEFTQSDSGRVAILEPILTWKTFSPRRPIQAVSMAVLGALLVLATRGGARLLTHDDKGRKFLILSLPLSLFVLHGGTTVLGRMNIRPGPLALYCNSYYAYLPLLSLLIALYGVCACAVSGTRVRRSTALPVYLILLVGLVILSAHGGRKVHAINVAVREAMRPLLDVSNCVQRFIDRHKHEPDFSIAFDETVFTLRLNECHGLSPTLVLFRRYLNNHHPRYLFTLKKGVLTTYCADDSGATAKNTRSQVYPDLVKVGTTWNFYYFDGWYYGIALSDGFFCPRGKHYPGAIKARTLRDVESQLPAGGARHHAPVQQCVSRPRQADTPPATAATGQ